MSTMEEKAATQQESAGPARRAYRSLESARGFRLEGPHAYGATPERRVVSIEPMDTRSYWQHDGRGKWDSADAQYTKVEEHT